VLKHTVVVDGK